MADSLRLKNSSTPTYMAILDEKGEMVSALVDVQSLNHLNNTFIDSKASLIKGAAYVFVDANNPILLEHILRTYSKNTRFVLDPISTAKAETVKHLMPCSVLKWNLHQTRSLSALMKLYVWLPYPFI